MPYKTQNLALGDAFLKRSSKLIPCQMEMVLWWRNKGESYNQLAGRFHVSKRLAYWICNPDKQQENYQKRVENGGSKQYYDKTKHTKAIREHRRYKHELLKPTVK
jgi:hypothetical protein